MVPALVAAAAVTLFYVLDSASSAAPAAPKAAAVNPNCSLVVPPNPLTATGLSTPYQLVATNAGAGACNEANAGQAAFVEATILDPANGALSVYRPLVINQGTKPAAAPVVPTLPANAVVGVWFGFNGTTLTLQNNNGSLNQGACVNGLQNSLFGQFAYCNAPAFFTAANKAIAAGQLAVPPLGMAKDGQTCPTTRDFGIIDQDQSDNLVTTYLVLGNGLVAQNNAANKAALAGSNPIINGSDNLLLDAFIDPAIGCQPFTAPDLTNNGQPVSSLALDELQAAAGQKAPIALVPLNDPMTLVNANQSQTKVNLYRAGVDQGQINAATDTPTAYCQNMVTVGQQRTQLDKNLTMGGPSPDPAAANNLFTFLANRLSQSFVNLGCGNLLHIANPVTVAVNGNGVAIGATFGATTPVPPVCGAGGGPTTTTAGAVPTTTGAVPTTTGAVPTTTGAATGTTTAPAGTGSTTAGMGATTTGGVAMTTTVAPTTTLSGTSSVAATTTGTAAPTTTTATCVSTPPTTTPTNADSDAAHHARHHPHKY